MNKSGRVNNGNEISSFTKTILTIVFCIIILLLARYLFTCDGVLVETKMIDQGAEKYVIEDLFHRVDFIYIVQWILVILLAAIVWMWREKFGITGFVGIQGESPKIEQSSNDNQVTQDDKVEYLKTIGSPQAGTISASKTVIKTVKEKKDVYSRNVVTDDVIVQLLNKYSALSIAKIASHLNVSDKTILNTVRNKPELFREGGRQRGSSEVITYAKSAENVALDDFIKNNVHDKVVSDIRPAQIGDYEADAIVETEDSLYLFELKKRFNAQIIRKVVDRLRLIAEKFRNTRIHLVLIYLDDPEDMNAYYETRLQNILFFANLYPKLSLYVDLQIYLASELKDEPKE